MSAMKKGATEERKEAHSAGGDINMDTNKMELSMEQMKQVSGSAVCSGAEPARHEFCKHPNKVKTSIGYEEYT